MYTLFHLSLISTRYHNWSELDNRLLVIGSSSVIVFIDQLCLFVLFNHFIIYFNYLVIIGNVVALLLDRI